jgi:hypothetical protein
MMTDRGLIAAASSRRPHNQGQLEQPGQTEVRREAAPIRDGHLFCGLKSLMSSLGSPVVALISTCFAQ